MAIYKLGFSRIIYDKTALENSGSKKNQINSGVLSTSGAGSTLLLSVVLDPFFEDNFLVGLNTFYLVSQNSL